MGSRNLNKSWPIGSWVPGAQHAQAVHAHSCNMSLFKCSYDASYHACAVAFGRARAMCGCLHQGGLGLSGPIDHAGRAMLRNHVRARDNGQWPATAAAQCPAGVCHMLHGLGMSWARRYLAQRAWASSLEHTGGAWGWSPWVAICS